MIIFSSFSLKPRIISMFALGFSAGLPFMLVFSTLSAWLTQSGIKRATIGMLAWVGIAYSLKFLWSPIVDQYRLPFIGKLLGQRRSWIFIGQCGIVFGLINISFSDPAVSILRVATFSLVVAFFSATQDIALDAWRIESAPSEMQGGMAAAYQLGYRVAIAAASAGALWLAADYGWATTYALMAVLASTGIITTIVVAEPLRFLPIIPRGVGESFFDAVVNPFFDFFRRHGLVLGILIFSFISTYRLSDYAMGVMANPFYLDMGFTLKQVATVVKGYGVIMSVVGIVVGGAAVAHLGQTKSLVLGGFLVIISNLSFALFAALGQPSITGLALIISLDNLALGVHGTALISFMSTLTNIKYTATQYALLSSLYALPGKLLMGTSGFVVEGVGYSSFFIYTAILSFPGLVLLWILAKRGHLKHLSKSS